MMMKCFNRKTLLAASGLVFVSMAAALTFLSPDQILGSPAAWGFGSDARHSPSSFAPSAVAPSSFAERFGLTQAQVAQATTPANPAPSAASAAPQRTETTVYDNWTVTCQDAVGVASKKVCSAVLKMVDQNRGVALFAWLIGRNNEGALLSVLQTPTNVMIQKGVELKIGNANVRKLSFSTCTTQNCEAALVMDDALNKELAAAQNATATIAIVGGQNMNFNIILKGADKAVGVVSR